MELRTLDRRVAAAGRRVKVLSVLRWPAKFERPFLERGVLPRPEPPPVGLEEEEEVFRSAVAALDPQEPAHAFVRETAASLLSTIEMLRAVGTPRFTERSIELFGAPQDPLEPFARTNLEGAEHFLRVTQNLSLPEPVRTLTSKQARTWMAERVGVPVLLAPELASLAAAGSKRVRLRDGTHYSESQLRQFVEHEYWVHTITRQNGQAQSLECLGLSAPRTLGTQEGLATLAELVTNTLDVTRLRRIALRTHAVQAALDGADFPQVHALFMDHGASREEAYQSAVRVFRGGDPRGGGICFTKDTLYVRGLLRVHAFFVAALNSGRPELIRLLFAGRVALSDVVTLADSGHLQVPALVPSWVREPSSLAAWLAWGGFNASLPLAHVELQAFASVQKVGDRTLFS